MIRYKNSGNAARFYELYYNKKNNLKMNANYRICHHMNKFYN